MYEGNGYLISGSRDKTVKLWSQEGAHYREGVTLKDHSNYISAVFYLATEDWICSASNDATVQIYRAGELKPFAKLEGHASTVSCIAAGLDARSLITGSWDKTARIWRVALDSNEVSHQELTGHEAAVWSVTTLSGEKFVTGSADKTIFVWNREGQRVRVLKGHTDCVRSIVGLPNGHLVSAGNDAVIKVWNDLGECVKNLYGHDNYIYTMSLVSPTVIVTGSEDSTLRLWDLQSGEQLGDALSVPAQSVWSVCALKNGDIVSGSSDAVVRVFTKDAAAMVDEETQRIYDANVATFRAEKTKDLGGIKVNDLPGPESLLVEGTDGQTRIVREKDGRIMCYKWEAGQWNLVGDVTGASGGDQQSSGKTLFEGQEYDYVFSVDIEDGKPAIKLPYNNGEDPYMAAQRFIHKHDLPQAYLDQVANFIIQNSSNAPVQQTASSQAFYDPFTGGSRYVPGSDNGRDLPSGVNLDPFTGGSSYSSNKTASTAARFFPTNEYRTFEAKDLLKILQKLR